MAVENLEMDHSLHLAANLAAHNHEVENDDIDLDVTGAGHCNSKVLGPEGAKLKVAGGVDLIHLREGVEYVKKREGVN